MNLDDRYEMVVGLEVHCELMTDTKLFCGCRNAFGDEPNTNVCPVCLGLPGSLPVLNERVVEFAMRIGMALNCSIHPSVFHRKNYFYPDMPKDYQISQYDEPINLDGWIELPQGKRIGITRAHLEEDTGKTTHIGGTGRINASSHSLVDYNRAGVPLVEIVSEPDMRSGAEARAYVTELRAILIATGATDGRMEEGSMRVDANVSVRPVGREAFGTRCEIKNLNSLRSLQRAIEYEAGRQIDLLDDGDTVTQETRHWDEQQGRTSTMRSKEEAYDYRYFPEPDLVPLAPSQQWQDEVRAALPQMPAARRSALVATVAGEASVALIDQVAAVVDNDLDAFVLDAVAAGIAGELAISRAANELAGSEGAAALATATFTQTLAMEQSGALTATQAKTVLGDLIEAGGGDPAAVAAERGFEQIDSGALESIVGDVIAANPDPWGRFCAGEDKVSQFFIGQVMKITKGSADGKAIVAELNRLRG